MILFQIEQYIKAPEIPARPPAIENIIVLNMTGLYPVNLTRGSSSRIPMRIFPNLPLTTHFAKNHAAITRMAVTQKNSLCMDSEPTI